MCETTNQSRRCFSGGRSLDRGEIQSFNTGQYVNIIIMCVFLDFYLIEQQFGLEPRPHPRFSVPGKSFPLPKDSANKVCSARAALVFSSSSDCSWITSSYSLLWLNLKMLKKVCVAATEHHRSTTHHKQLLLFWELKKAPHMSASAIDIVNYPDSGTVLHRAIVCICLWHSGRKSTPYQVGTIQTRSWW